ncbi:MAG: TonB-dependent receptor [Rubrivivax sp.]
MKISNRVSTKARVARAGTLSAVAGAVLLLSAQAQAQQTQTITVTGIRSAIESAISVKKSADGVVEALSAEDIGKLPDTSIAESLARLPGVTAQRTKTGQASAISIRGLGPDFNGYLLNGREQTSIGDSRGVDLSAYPAELIGSAVVYKSGDAGLMTAGLAGTIDIRLVDPLAFPKRVVAASYQDLTTGEGLPVKGSGSRFSLSYIDQFADRKIGVALGFVRSDGTSNSISVGGWGGNDNATVKLASGATQSGVKVPGPWGNGLDLLSQRYTDDRTGMAAIVTFRPNKDFTSQLDYFESKIDSYTKKLFIKGGLNSGSGITNATVVGGVVTKGTYQLGANPDGLVVYSEGIGDNDTIKSMGWKNSLKFAKGWEGTLDINSTTSKRVERDIEAYAGINTADTLNFDNSSGSVQFSVGSPLSYTDPTKIVVRDQTGWSGIGGVPQHGYSKGPTITDKVSAVRLDFKHDLGGGGMFQDLQFGVNHSKRTKDRFTDEGLVVASGANNKAQIPYPSNSYVTSNVAGTGLNVLTFDPQVGLWNGATILRKYNDDILSKTWGVKETVLTTYLKSSLETKMMGLPVRGNVGVQVVNTDQSASGYQAQVGSDVTLVNPASTQRTDGTKYTDVLPSLNLTGELGADSVLRLGLSQQIARPTLTDLRNSFAASVDTNPGNTATFGRFVGSAGNPYLKPFKAVGLDLSWEKYFGGNKGYVSAAAFYKDLDSYITKATNTSYDFTKYATALGLTIPPKGAVGVFTTSVNGSGGTLSGVELSASVPFGMLAKALDGFGVSASYSSTDSSVNLPDTTGQNPNQQVTTGGSKIPMPGLSKDNTKVVLYFEKAGFSAFIAHNQRSTFVGSVANDAVGGYPTLRYIQGSAWVSAQVGYEFQSGMFKGLGLRFEGNNLNKPVYRQLKANGDVDFEQKTGADVAIKVTYKL